MRAAVCALFIFAVIGFVAPKPYGGQTSSDLSPWAQAHMTEVREMANKLRNEYNIQASGRSSGMLNLNRYQYDVCFGSSEFPKLCFSFGLMDLISAMISLILCVFLFPLLTDKRLSCLIYLLTNATQ